MALFIPLAFVGLFLVIRGLVTLANRRYRTSLTSITAGLLLIALFLWILHDWNQTLIRVNQQSQHQSPTPTTSP